MRLKKIGKSALDFGIKLLPLENYYDGCFWTNGKTYEQSIFEKINKIMDEVYEKYPSRVIISFKNSYPALSTRCIQIRREAGYGEDVVSFFADYGFYYDMGAIAQKIAKEFPDEKEEFNVESFGLALNPISDYFDGTNWIAKSGKVFDQNTQNKINYIFEKILEWYPNRIIYLINKYHSKFCEGTLLNTRRLTGYTSNGELFNDFGFEYLSQSQLADLKEKKVTGGRPKKEKVEKQTIEYPIIKIDENGVLIEYRTDKEEVIIPKEVKNIRNTSIKPNFNLKITFEEGCNVVIESSAFKKTQPYSIDFSNCKSVIVKKGGFFADNEIKLYGLEKISILERDAFNNNTFNKNNYKEILKGLGLMAECEPYYNIFTSNYIQGGLGYRKIYLSNYRYNVGDVIGSEIIIGVSKAHKLCEFIGDRNVIKNDIQTLMRNVYKNPEDVEFLDYDKEEFENLLVYLGYLSKECKVEESVKCIDQIEFERNRYSLDSNLTEEINENATLLEALIGINNNRTFNSYPQFMDNDMYIATFMKYNSCYFKLINLYSYLKENPAALACIFNEHTIHLFQYSDINLTKDIYIKMLPKIRDKNAFEFQIRDKKCW